MGHLLLMQVKEIKDKSQDLPAGRRGKEARQAVIK